MTKERVFHNETDRTHTTNIANQLLLKKYLLINVICNRYAIQIFYSGQKEL